MKYITKKEHLPQHKVYQGKMHKLQSYQVQIIKINFFSEEEAKMKYITKKEHLPQHKVHQGKMHKLQSYRVQIIKIK